MEGKTGESTVQFSHPVVGSLGSIPTPINIFEVVGYIWEGKKKGRPRSEGFESLPLHQERRKMKTVRANELSKLRMAAGNEKKYPAVIDNGILKEWVAIGWVDLRKATEDDHKKFPVVVRS